MVRFGHDGWLGQLARDVTFDSVESVARAAGTVMVRDHESGARLVVGYDRRFLADSFARAIARDLASIGLDVTLVGRPIPLPAFSYLIQHAGAIGGVMVTGGNAPADFSGLRLRGWDGGALPRWMLERIEERVAAKAPIRRIGPTARVTMVDPIDDYLGSVAKNVPLSAIRQSGITVAIDSLWGTGSELIPALTDGDGSRSIEIRSAHNPLFPELTTPTPGFENLERLRRIVRTGDAALGIAVGADGSTLGLTDELGAPISPGMTMAILSWYRIFLSKQKGALARSITASSTVDRIAAQADVLVHEMPHGYTASCEVLRQQQPMMLGDAEGGFIFTSHLLERDAILAAVLIVGAIVRSKMDLSEIVSEIRELAGYRSLESTWLSVSSDHGELVRQRLIQNEWPATVGDERVIDMYATDGVKFLFENDAWLVMRYDDLEGQVHLVSEAPSTDQASRLLRAGRRLLTV